MKTFLGVPCRWLGLFVLGGLVGPALPQPTNFESFSVSRGSQPAVRAPSRNVAFGFISAVAWATNSESLTTALEASVPARVTAPQGLQASRELLELTATNGPGLSPSFSFRANASPAVAERGSSFLTSSETPPLPAWWSHREVLTGNDASDFSPANQGQVKWLATNAYLELSFWLPGDANTNVLAAIGHFTDGGNYLPVNVGQIKALAQPFYDRLQAATASDPYLTNNLPSGMTGVYPWTDTTDDGSDYAIANIGQLKYAFSFDFDRNDNGIPDAWEWKHFGNLDQSVTNDYDGDGISNGTEYTNATDPNTIVFTLAVTNQYVRSSSVPVTVALQHGVPNSMAILVDTTDFPGATWQAYQSNVPVDLGGTEGWHEVWIGLRGRSEDTVGTWKRTRFKLDTTPPVLVITSPINNPVTNSMIQVLGYSTESLQSINYDLANAAGLLTNQQVLVEGRAYSTNTSEFTTNYFQAYDVMLTNGANLITLRSTDLAGNVATLTTNIVCITSTNPPTVSLIWPQDGMQICGNNLTIKGQVNDSTATVTLSVDGAGNTNFYSGRLGRDGVFWIENVLLQGTKHFTLKVETVAGATTTDFTLTQNATALTIEPVAAGQSMISGSMSEPGYTIAVNGVTAVQDNGVWTAEITPIGIGGGLVQVTAVPANNQDPNLNLAATVQPPSGVFVAQHHYHARSDGYVTSDLDGSRRLVGWRDDFDWVDGKGGRGYTGGWIYYDSAPFDWDWWYWFGGWDYLLVEVVNWPENHWPEPPPNGLQTDVYSYSPSSGRPSETNTYDFPPGSSALPWAIQELWHYDFAEAWPWDAASGKWRWNVDFETRLATGGPLGSTQKSVWRISATATDQNTGLPIPPDQIQIGTFGNLDANGNLYVILPDNDPPVITPEVPGFDNYTYNVNAERLTPSIAVESADRFVHGVIQGVPADEIALAIEGGGKSYGAYHHLLPALRPPNAGPILSLNQPEIYDYETNILSETEVAAMDAGTYQYGGQDVIFVKDETDPTKIHFYTVADNYDKLKITMVSRVGYSTATVILEHPLGQNGSARSVFTNSSFTQTITPPATPVNGNRDLSSFINYADIRINSPEIDAIPLAQGGGGPRAIQQRNLLVKSLLGYGKSWLNQSVNSPVALVRGGVEGFWAGVKSDYDGLAGASSLAGRISASSAERAAVLKEITSISLSGIYNQTANSLGTLLSDAEKNAVLISISPGDWSDEVVVRFYVGGYAMGFATEQIISMTVGAAAASKVGAEVATQLAKTASGKLVLTGVSTLQKSLAAFRTRAMGWVTKTVADTGIPTLIVEKTRKMVTLVENLPATYNGKKVGQIIGDVEQSLTGFYDELRAIGKPLDDFGVKAHNQLAKILERDLGFFPGEKAVRGAPRLLERLIVGSGDRWDDLAQLFTKADGTVGKGQLRETLEAAKDEVDRAIAAGDPRPRFPVKNYHNIYPDLYHHFKGGNAAERLVFRDGKYYLTASPYERGRYVTPEKFDAIADATGRLQLLNSADGRYRARISTTSVKDNLKMAYGNNDFSGYLELLTRDDPALSGGAGLARQLLVQYREAELLDLWDTVDQRFLTQQEISNLIYGQ